MRGAGRRSRRFPWVLLVLALVLVAQLVVVAALLTEDAEATPSATLDAVYEVPDPLPKAAPGTPIRVWRLNAPEVQGTVYGVLYHSVSLAGEDTAVSGYIAVPSGEAPPGGRPVVSFSHGTVGGADECAPSRVPAADADTINPFLTAGWVVAATDFEGIGGTGDHPYLIGTSEARSMIDVVRAAGSLLGPGASDNFAAWGISQGGHAALFTRELAAEWAPDLKMVGAVAVAPVSDVAGFLDAPTIAPQAVTLLAAVGAVAGNPSVAVSDLLTESGVEAAKSVGTQCLGELNLELEKVALDDLRQDTPSGTLAWEPILAANTPGNAPSEVPVLLVQGTRDPIIPIDSTMDLLRRLCATEADAQIDVIRDGSHGDVVVSARDTYLGWLQARFEGEAPASDC